jgi:hypothetical protein
MSFFVFIFVQTVVLISRQIYGSGFLPSHFLISYQYKLVMFTKGLLIISGFVWNSSGIFSYQESTSDLSRILLLSYQYGNATCYQGPNNLVTNR